MRNRLMEVLGWMIALGMIAVFVPVAFIVVNAHRVWRNLIKARLTYWREPPLDFWRRRHSHKT